jgi:hypothetical protein
MLILPNDDGESIMPDIHKFIDDLKTARDEAKLKIHLGSKDAQDEWAALEKRWHAFKSKAELEKSAGELSGAVKQLGSELKHAYARLRQAL